MNKTGHTRLLAALAAILIGFSLNAQPWPKGINGNVRDAVAQLSNGHAYSFDDWTQYAPAAAYAALGFIPGIEHESSLVKRGCTFIGGFGFLAATTLLTKEIAGEMRPDGSGYDSFPSGHSGKAFLGAELVRMEFGNGWGAAAYGIAGTTAFMRIWNDKHWLTDVVAGAALGILSAHVGDWACSFISFDPISQSPLLAINITF
ncbi:MAG: phosphatase PAP2 family protein [Bacteroidales bacterium]|nr:phosphatase PAP2 family protein [Bacteroidales bacterium]